MVIGNKADCPKGSREVRKEEAQAYALSNDFLWMETDATLPDTVHLAFDVFIGQVYHSMQHAQPMAYPVAAERRNSAPVKADDTTSQTLIKRASVIGMGLVGTLGKLGSSMLDFVEGQLEGQANDRNTPTFNVEEVGGETRQGRIQEHQELVGNLGVGPAPLKRAKSMDHKPVHF